MKNKNNVIIISCIIFLLLVVIGCICYQKYIIANNTAIHNQVIPENQTNITQPNFTKMPDIPSVPEMPTIPRVPKMPSMPSMPSIPGIN